ncbi:hypothetical protein PGUG_04268 [Meyerozyma guilliermondii ATCC 6260]|uniref:Uncharacterized protein n=1 Tax=Meyerozyma guilliermondii (strain ATCC 6260 / CBS 566 / DSM 6381 / JCM 1539 / NBRC 10279 / NRRL Y-324) TaxID=294746 RepID=A5DLW7_PICGU|nr:uncharacterized protein PGUG_04268 [Meyerozyma guilliermondii ATCC 6260]EDK40170.2 hypothetical protein PGUG_04268 [Meyerozyma guilliermondii ATCC 6260]
MSAPPYDLACESVPSYQPSSESLPEYKQTLHFGGLCLMKTEFSTPYHYNSRNRGWSPVFLEINSTEIKFYNLNIDKKLLILIETLYYEANSLHDLAANINNDRLKRDKKPWLDTSDVDLFGDDPYGASFSPEAFKQTRSDRVKLKFQKAKQGASAKMLPKFYSQLQDNGFLFEPTTNTEITNNFKSKYAGELIHRYTLANCDVGEAPSLNQVISAMYKETSIDSLPQSTSTLVKYKNVLRLRVELKQILLQFWSFYGMVHWYRNILIGGDLASPLESRIATKVKSIPSRQTRLNNALLVATAAAASYRQEPSQDEENFPAGEICFNDPFSTGETIKPSNTRPCSCSENGSVCTTPDSVFSERRESVATTESSSSDTKCHYSKTMHSYKLVSYDRYYTTLEKQYISNCIPDLNSFDKWQSIGLTLSNFKQYMSKSQLKHYEKDPQNVYISIGELIDGVSQYDKTSPSNGPCRSFVVHQSGLVSVTT